VISWVFTVFETIVRPFLLGRPKFKVFWSPLTESADEFAGSLLTPSNLTSGFTTPSIWLAREAPFGTTLVSGGGATVIGVGSATTGFLGGRVEPDLCIIFCTILGLVLCSVGLMTQSARTALDCPFIRDSTELVICCKILALPPLTVEFFGGPATWLLALGMRALRALTAPLEDFAMPFDLTEVSFGANLVVPFDFVLIIVTFLTRPATWGAAAAVAFVAWPEIAILTWPTGVVSIGVLLVIFVEPPRGAAAEFVVTFLENFRITVFLIAFLALGPRVVGLDLVFITTFTVGAAVEELSRETTGASVGAIVCLITLPAPIGIGSFWVCCDTTILLVSWLDLVATGSLIVTFCLLPSASGAFSVDTSGVDVVTDDITVAPSFGVDFVTRGSISFEILTLSELEVELEADPSTPTLASVSRFLRLPTAPDAFGEQKMGRAYR